MPLIIQSENLTVIHTISVFISQFLVKTDENVKWHHMRRVALPLHLQGNDSIKTIRSTCFEINF